MLDRVEYYMNEIVNDIKSEYVSEIFSELPQGKKLRSKLILQIASSNEKAPLLAAIVELIHLASLLHDDVIDEAELRRGVASVNAVYGDKSAIMLGDILYSKAYFELVSFDREIAKIISNAVSLLSLGELNDVRLSKRFNPDEKEYFEMIYQKTASLIEASALSAAVLEGKNRENFSLYGKNLGLAFQIVDDILDITQDESKLGKPAMNDFREGKTTLPYIYLHQSLDEKGKEKLKSLYGKELREDEKEWIKESMIKTGSLDRAIKRAKELGYEALDAIKEENKQSLQKVIKEMIERDF